MPAKVTEIIAKLIAARAQQSFTLNEVALETAAGINEEYQEEAPVVFEGLAIGTLKSMVKSAAKVPTQGEMEGVLVPIVGELGGGHIAVRVTGERDFRYKPFGLCTWAELSAHHERKAKASADSKKAADNFREQIGPLMEFMVFDKTRNAYEAALMLNQKRNSA